MGYRTRLSSAGALLNVLPLSTRAACRLPALWCALLFMLGSGGAGAAPLLELGGGLQPDRPFAGIASSAGPGATYSNPAFLASEGVQFQLGFVSQYRDLSIDLEPRPEGYDVPAEIRRAREITPDGVARLDRRPLPTADLRQPRRGESSSGHDMFLQVGSVVPILPERLGFGFQVALPTSTFQSQSPFYVDEREQYFSNALHFERLGDRLELGSFMGGFGLRVIDQIDIGVGATMLNSARTLASIYLPDAAEPEVVETNTVVAVEASLVPHFGVVIRPLTDERLRLGATVHLPGDSRVDGNSELQFFDYDYPEGQSALFQSFEYVFAHEPLRVGFGASGAVALGERSLDVHFESQWARWSAYRDRHDARPADWVDTLDLRVGARLSDSSSTWAAGLMYAPSPVPEQTGRTNYVDNSRLGVQLGWHGAWDRDGWRLTAGLGTQLQVFLERAHFKRTDAADPVIDEFPDAVDAVTGAPIPGSAGVQTNNPGFPGYRSGGAMLTTMLTVGVAR